MSAGCKDMPLDKALNIVDPDSHTRANPDMPIQEQKETFLNACRVVCAAVRHAEPENKALTAENEELKGRFAGSGEKSEYIKVPNNLSRELLIREFGTRAVEWYESYLADRIREGKIYLNPQKTIYLWATRDRKTGGGWFSRLPRQYDGHKSKGHGGS